MSLMGSESNSVFCAQIQRDGTEPFREIKKPKKVTHGKGNVESNSE